MKDLQGYFQKVREQFPGLDQKIRGQNLVYLDSAATTLKPVEVIDRMRIFYEREVSNVHRGAHFLADRATENFETARKTVGAFLNAQDVSEIVFTKGTTESLNLVAQSFGSFLKAGDEILLSEVEHHSNIVPWHLLAKQRGLVVRMFSVNEEGFFDFEDFQSKLSDRTRLVSLTACSNILGHIENLVPFTKKAHEFDAVVVVDGAQAVSRRQVDVKKLDCDFFAFSAHKLFGPFGVGVLYGKRKLLDMMPPYQGGGSMISSVLEDHSTFRESPFRFEAGTPNISGVLGLEQALKFVEKIGLKKGEEWEASLGAQFVEKLVEISGVKLACGRRADVENWKSPIVSFNIEGVHHSDLAQLLDQQGFAVRAGHLCAQPFLRNRGLEGVVRVSFSIYNTLEEIDSLILGIQKGKRMLL